MTFTTCHSSKKIKMTDLFDAEKVKNCGYGLLFFFSPHSCPPCMDVVVKLNELAHGLPIIGVVDPTDLNDVKKMSGRFSFPIEAMCSKFLTYTPLLSPSLVAIDRHGRILMTLPGLPDQDGYIEQILWELTPKAMGL
jgi:hypothetical protein